MSRAVTERLCDGVADITVLSTGIAVLESVERRAESGESATRGTVSAELAAPMKVSAASVAHDALSA